MSFDWQYASGICVWIELFNLIIATTILVVSFVGDVSSKGGGIMSAFSSKVISAYHWGFKVKIFPTSSTPDDLEAQSVESATVTTRFFQACKNFAFEMLAPAPFVTNFMLHLFLTLYLFLATYMNDNPESALHYGKLWRIWTIVLLLLEILNVFIGKKYWKSKPHRPPIYRYISLFIVSRYIAELEAASL